jgi:hypothetical protein
MQASGIRLTSAESDVRQYVGPQIKVSGPRWNLLEIDGSISKKLLNMHYNSIFYTEKM